VVSKRCRSVSCGTHQQQLIPYLTAGIGGKNQQTLAIANGRRRIADEALPVEIGG
jgi:hypothetical protein